MELYHKEKEKLFSRSIFSLCLVNLPPSSRNSLSFIVTQKLIYLTVVLLFFRFTFDFFILYCARENAYLTIRAEIYIFFCDKKKNAKLM